MVNSICTLLVDSGADISIFKLNNVLAHQHIDNTFKTKITGITEGEIETLGATKTMLEFGNGSQVEHIFHLVQPEFPILTDGILGRDFLSSFKCNIDYEFWLLNFNINNRTVSIPIQDTVEENYIIPQRCEVVRKLKNLDITEDMVLFSQEIKPGVFCGSTIISPSSQYIKFINTTNLPVNISSSGFKPTIEPMTDYKILNIDSFINS